MASNGDASLHQEAARLHPASRDVENEGSGEPNTLRANSEQTEQSGQTFVETAAATTHSNTEAARIFVDEDQSPAALLARIADDHLHDFGPPNCVWGLLPRSFEHAEVEAAFQANYVRACSCDSGLTLMNVCFRPKDGSCLSSGWRCVDLQHRRSLVQQLIWKRA